MDFGRHAWYFFKVILTDSANREVLGRNTANEHFPIRPKGATQKTQYGVAGLEKDMPFSAVCALSWVIWAALNMSISL